MGVAAVSCPYCGHEVEADCPADGRMGGTRRRLKPEYRASRNTCSECGSQYDIRLP